MNVKFIAQEAGVSTATVSRVLNHHSSVSVEVRNRVQEVIRRTGWSPNPSARTLSRGRALVLGIVLPGINSYFEEPVEALSRLCRQEGYGLMVTTHSYENASPEQEVSNIRLLEEKQVDGIVFFPTRDHPSVWAALQGLGKKMPVVVLGKDWHREGFPSVYFDDALGARDLMGHLVDLGRTRTAFISGPDYDRTSRIRHAVWQDFRDRGLLLQGKGWDYQGWFEIPSGYKGARKIWEESGFRDSELPDSLVCANDLMALGALRYFQERGIRVPEDVALAGFDGAPVGQYLFPRLTTVRQDTFSAGQAAGELLLERLRNKEGTSKSVVIHHELIIGESTRGGRAYAGM